MTITDSPREFAEIVDPGELFGFNYEIVVSESVEFREFSGGIF